MWGEGAPALALQEDSPTLWRGALRADREPAPHAWGLGGHGAGAALAPAAPPCSGTTLAGARLCPETTVALRPKLRPQEGAAPRVTRHCSRLRCQQEITAFYLDSFGLPGSRCSLASVVVASLSVQRELLDVYLGRRGRVLGQGSGVPGWRLPPELAGPLPAWESRGGSVFICKMEGKQ